MLCGDAGANLAGRGWALPSLVAAPTTRTRRAARLGGGGVPVTVAELWARGEKRDPMRQNERRAHPTMLPGALRRVPSPFAPRALRRSIHIPAKFSPPALTPSLSLPPRAALRGGRGR